MKIEKEEMTRQFETIFREYQDPEVQARKRAKQKREEQLEYKKIDLGL
mgnify:CR=1 FL=1